MMTPRSIRAALVAACLAAGLAGCAGETATPSQALTTGTVEIETGSGVVTLRVEVADTPEERRVGLMFRDELAADAGMLFLYDAPASGGLWMRDTTIPLSAAFFDASGRIIALVDMPPCTADPCPRYAPDTPYSGALEVNLGAFDAWGVAVGDRVTHRLDPS
jgi:uncharacterized membrane protein (UPF0127 family)